MGPLRPSRGLLANMMQPMPTTNVPTQKPLGSGGLNTVAIGELKAAISAIGGRYRIPREQLRAYVERAVAELLSASPQVLRNGGPAAHHNALPTGMENLFPPAATIRNNAESPGRTVQTGGGGSSNICSAARPPSFVIRQRRHCQPIRGRIDAL